MLSHLIPITCTFSLPQVWNCSQCYRLFHLRCIQQWAVDGVKQKSILSPELFPNQQRLWSCPNCRSDYTQSQCPKVVSMFLWETCKNCIFSSLVPFLSDISLHEGVVDEEGVVSSTWTLPMAVC